MILYRINWISLYTGAKGNGKPCFYTIEEAFEIAKEANQRYGWMVLHYPQGVKL